MTRRLRPPIIAEHEARISALERKVGQPHHGAGRGKKSRANRSPATARDPSLSPVPGLFRQTGVSSDRSAEKHLLLPRDDQNIQTLGRGTRQLHRGYSGRTAVLWLSARDPRVAQARTSRQPQARSSDDEGGRLGSARLTAATNLQSQCRRLRLVPTARHAVGARSLALRSLILRSMQVDTCSPRLFLFWVSSMASLYGGGHSVLDAAGHSAPEPQK